MPEMVTSRTSVSTRINPRQTMVNILYTKTPKPEPDPNIFIEENIGNFIHTTMVIIRSVTPPFFMSTIRKLCVMHPKEPNWWGTPLVQSMKRDGYFQTGRYQKSLTKTRNGAVEWEWDLRKKNEPA
jgi:hypothetical protein